jgi:hypothetical protein
VSIFHPLILDVDGEECRFEYSCFEYQNEVIAGRNPSNIDVVLVGKRVHTGKLVVLFLESKFSEYYERPGKQLGIAREYLGENYAEWIYKSDLLNRLQIMSKTDNVDDEKEFLIKSNENCYLEGIKQMISHYIGVCNRCNALKSTSDAVFEAIKRGAIVYLGEIVFDRGIGDLEIADGRKCFDSYEEKYSGLTKILNEHLESEGKSEQIVVLNELYRYSLFENNGFEIEPLIRRFYFELGKENI